MSEGELSMAVSPLESEHFGLVVGRADFVTADDIPALLRFCEDNEVELIVARCDGRDVAATRGLLDAGMVSLEAQITYEGELLRLPQAQAEEVREATAEDAEAIAGIARRGFAGMPGHYHLDPRLPLDACTEVYVDWSLRGLRGDAAKAVFVAEIDGRAVGYTTVTSREDRFHPLLTTVEEAHRRRGLHVSLFARGMEWGLSQGFERLIVTTPTGNIAVQRNEIRHGLRPVLSTATFHGWRDRLERPA